MNVNERQLVNVESLGNKLPTPTSLKGYSNLKIPSDKDRKNIPMSLSEMMELCEIDTVRRDIVIRYVPSDFPCVDGISIRLVTPYIYLHNLLGKVIVVKFGKTFHFAQLSETLIILLNALLDSPSLEVTKADMAKIGQEWNTCITKYYRINDACLCELISTGSKANSLQLNLEVIPEMTYQDWEKCKNARISIGAKH